MKKCPLGLLALVAVAGCSYFNVHGPHTTAPTQEEELDCTEDSKVPEFDIGGAIGAALLGTLGCVRLHQAHADGLFMCPLLVVGVLDGVSAAYGYRDMRRCKEAKVYQEDMRTRGLKEIETKRMIEIRQEAHELTEQAAADARADDCVGVWEIQTTLMKLDEEFYRTVFLANIAIKRCLTPIPGKYKTTGPLDF